MVTLVTESWVLLAGSALRSNQGFVLCFILVFFFNIFFLFELCENFPPSFSFNSTSISPFLRIY
ncbi:hypothetical protein IE53DRAFT_38698 [Violaceomyces palustris]|uniref:Uncharacterized protein n=1 Tax=Violaceomyces palustris TaxID=1673888 RepID=A0ACD0P107_9BASI|nr:hypothetical protein IE53DRAFT_38698 [Violaceomyces palustris]